LKYFQQRSSKALAGNLETLSSRDAAPELTGKYLQRVSRLPAKALLPQYLQTQDPRHKKSGPKAAFFNTAKDLTNQ
jgi:hypothetical protein